MTQITATSDGVGVRAGGSYVGKFVSGTPTFTLQVDFGIGWNNLKDASGSDIQVTSSATYVDGVVNVDCKLRWELTSGSGTIDQQINQDGKT